MSIQEKKIKDIVNRLQTGDKEAFSELYRLFYPRIISFLLKILRDKNIAEEITQEVFFRLWVNHQSLNPDMSYETYFFNIAKNLAINFYKKKEIENKYRTNITEEENIGEENNFHFTELQNLIEDAIKKMPPQQQLIFRLSREEGLLNAEIANKLGISKRTVEKHISNSLTILRKLINKNYLLFFIH